MKFSVGRLTSSGVKLLVIESILLMGDGLGRIRGCEESD